MINNIFPCLHLICSSAVADIVSISYNWIALITIGVTIGTGYLFSLCLGGWKEGEPVNEKLLFKYSKECFSGCCNCCHSDGDSSYDINVS